MMLSFILHRNIVRRSNSDLYKQALFPIFKQIQTETNQSDLEQSRSDFLFIDNFMAIQLEPINTNTRWGDEAGKINSNNQRIINALSDVDALNQRLENVGTPIERYKDEVATIAALEALPIEQNEKGDGRVVTEDVNASGQSYTWVWDGSSWSRTPYTTLPADVALKGGLNKTIKELHDEFKALNVENGEYVEIKSLRGRLIDINADFLKAGNTIHYGLFEASLSTFNLAVFLHREDNTTLQLQPAFTSPNNHKTVTLTEDFVKIRFYCNTAPMDYTAFVTKRGSINDSIDDINLEVGNLIEEVDNVKQDVIDSSYQLRNEFKALNAENGENVKVQSIRNGQLIDLESDFLKAGNTINYGLLSASTASVNIAIYLFRSDNTFIQLQPALTQPNESRSEVLEEDFVKIRFYSNVDSIDYTAFVSQKWKVNERLDVLDSNAIQLNEYFKSSQPVERPIVWNNAGAYWNIKGNLITNESYDISAPIDTSDWKYYAYVGRLSKDNLAIVSVDSSNEFTGTIIEEGLLPWNKSGESLYIFKVSDSTNKISIPIQSIYKSKSFLFELKAPWLIKMLDSSELASKYEQENNPSLNVFIIGDSYSSGGAWINGMTKTLTNLNIVNLAVSSASVKDKYNDRVAYPYSNRPIQANSTGNLNTFACQIEKLKRLMDGTDLDAGETKLYTDPSQYPHIIIIEGGMNDNYDNEAKEATYFGQFTKQVNDVWYRNTKNELDFGNTFIKTPIDEVDRTCFAGAYRYLVEELSALFPDAQFFFTTASRLGYWSYDINVRRSKTAAQQRICAELCGANIIDWNKEGGINTIVNYPSGDGTEASPYLQTSIYKPDTNDGMHPTAYGGDKYGNLAASEIRQKYRRRK